MGNGDWDGSGETGELGAGNGNGLGREVGKLVSGERGMGNGDWDGSGKLVSGELP